MGLPAARVGDMTSHGTPLAPGPGSVNVLIGGMPAWKAAADFHTCPLVTGVVPHAGGVVAMGSVTVLINSLPAVRQGDMIIEVGPPNSIVMGCPTVLIG
ncbi:MAG: PAAR domain-containing protein [Candidatus Methanoperedens sp.]